MCCSKFCSDKKVLLCDRKRRTDSGSASLVLLSGDGGGGYFCPSLGVPFPGQGRGRLETRQKGGGERRRRRGGTPCPDQGSASPNRTWDRTLNRTSDRTRGYPSPSHSFPPLLLSPSPSPPPLPHSPPRQDLRQDFGQDQ